MKGQSVYVECVFNVAAALELSMLELQSRDSWDPLFEEIALLLQLFL